MTNKLIIAFIVLSLLGSAGGYITHIIAENARLESNNSQLETNLDTISKQWWAEREKLVAREKAYRETEVKHNEEVDTLQKSINEAIAAGDKCVNALVPDQLRHYTGPRLVVPTTDPRPD